MWRGEFLLRTKREHRTLHFMSHGFAPHLLTRSSHRHRAGAEAVLMGDLTLARARVHELCGGARRTLAVQVARGLEGPVFWIAPAHTRPRLNPEGLTGVIDPGRLVLLSPRRDEDILWCMEETLRAGAVALVVADLPGPPGLTPVRRLNLAAETGAAEGQIAPLGVILTPGRGGAPGVESRWSLDPAHTGTRDRRWTLDRRRARTEPQRCWTVRPAAAGGLALGGTRPVTEK
jgi:protein ImuA